MTLHKSQRYYTNNKKLDMKHLEFYTKSKKSFFFTKPEIFYTNQIALLGFRKQQTEIEFKIIQKIT